jgi:Domain of unknown function (DUF1906)
LQLAKLAKLVPAFSPLLLAACHDPPTSPPTAIEAPRSPAWGQGIDLPTDASNVLSELENSRVDFVARYYREPDSRWPALSASEAQRLSSQGLKIVAVWESHSADPRHFYYASGFGDAATAYGEARAVGQPAGSAIYFAVDFNAHGWEIGPIEDYFRGVAAGLGTANNGPPYYAIGVYGSGAVCEAMKATGLARYSWLSNSLSWEDSDSYDNWDILQGEDTPGLSFSQDTDQARGEYGAFRLAGPGGTYAGAVPSARAAPPPRGQALMSAIIPSP